MSDHKGQVVGYARVSSADQNLARQLQALGEVDRLFTEKVSGRTVDGRAQLKEMLAYVREGDTVLVKAPDRLARSTTDLLSIVETLRKKGVALRFVDNPALNTDSAEGELMLTILAALAQMERRVIRERQAEGIALARQRGVYERAPKLAPEQVEEARRRVSDGVPKAVVARDLGVSRFTLRKALDGEGIYSKTSGPDTVGQPSSRVGTGEATPKEE